MRGLRADLHTQPAAFCRDGKVAIAEAPDQIKRFSRRLLPRQAHLVVGDAALDDLAHMRCRAEESIRWHQTSERLVWPLEVVCVDEVHRAAVAVRVVRKHRARQKLVPQRLPEALDLAERLRVLRPTLDVPDAVLAKLLFEFRLAAPGRVLPALVRQHFLRRAVLCDAARQRFHHQHRALVMRQRKRQQETRVVIHEARQIEPLVLAQEKREDVALPELVRLRTLEAAGRMLACPLTLALRHHAGLMQDLTHLRLRDAQCFEACK